MPFGKATVVFPEASEERCSAAILIDVDSVGLARGESGGLWSEYVNDRPYVSSSFLSRALTEFFSTTMSGRSKERQSVADLPIPLELLLPVVKCRGGEAFLRQLFGPLGYEIAATQLLLDDRFPEWGTSSYFTVTLKQTCLLKDALEHLYVLIPVLDDDKHYWVNQDEIDKLIRRGGSWLLTHPAREEITVRYLRHQKSLTRVALARLAELDDVLNPDERDDTLEEATEKLEQPMSLHTLRIEATAEVILNSGARRVLDLGCGEGRLIKKLLPNQNIVEVVGVDVTLRSLEKVRARLRWDQLADKLKEKLKLVHGSVTYRDKELEGYDAAALVEVIEHLDLSRLSALERVVFEFARPRTVVVTTPNQEYNALFEGLADGAMRHGDHRFEWTRSEFDAWCKSVSDRFAYRYSITPIGPTHEQYGAPSQMAVFTI